jgi:hypothetical protein
MNSYYDEKEKKCVVPSTKIANSVSLKTSTTVNECESGYAQATTLTTNTAGYTSCVKIDTTIHKNCIQGIMINNVFTCLECSGGNSLVTSNSGSTTLLECAPTTTSNCTPTNCDSCSGLNICATCKKGFVNIDLTSCITSTLTNCAMATNANVCKVCEHGFYLHNSICHKSAVTVFGKILSLLLVFIL